MIAIDEPVPSLGYHGGGVAAPVFSAVVGPALLYLGVPPDNQEPGPWPGERVASSDDGLVGESPLKQAEARGVESIPETGGVPDFSGLTARQAVVRSAELGLKATLHGSGMVSRQAPPPGTAVEEVGSGMQLWLAVGPGEAGR